jgi:hypothetical protein
MVQSYYEKNKPKIKEYQNTYNFENKEERYDYFYKYYQLNKNEINEKHRLYREKNKEKLRQNQAKYNKINKEKVNENKMKSYYKIKHESKFVISESPKNLILSFN